MPEALKELQGHQCHWTWVGRKSNGEPSGRLRRHREPVGHCKLSVCILREKPLDVFEHKVGMD